MATRERKRLSKLASERMSKVRFDMTEQEVPLIFACAKRAYEDLSRYGNPGEAQDAFMVIAMDLAAVNANGCPLDFQKLLDFPDFDFAHDLYGIRKHLDRVTGGLVGCFVPRCARLQAQTPELEV